jgi:hypothetical protein
MKVRMIDMVTVVSVVDVSDGGFVLRSFSWIDG